MRIPCMAELAALGLVCNILQVAEYSLKILSRGEEIRKSKKGALLENESLEECAKQLLSKNVALKQSLEASSNIAAEERDEDERALDVLARDCNKEAQYLIEKLRSISSNGSTSGWSSIRGALKSVWEKDSIDAAAQRMQDYQQTIDSRLIQSIRYHPLNIDHAPAIFMLMPAMQPATEIDQGPAKRWNTKA